MKSSPQNNFTINIMSPNKPYSSTPQNINTPNLVDELRPFFFMKTDKVEEFIALAKVAHTPLAISKIVNSFVIKGFINCALSSGQLWMILHKANLYTLGKASWYNNVHFKK